MHVTCFIPRHQTHITHTKNKLNAYKRSLNEIIATHQNTPKRNSPKIQHVIIYLTESDVNPPCTHNKCLSVSHQTISQKRNTTKGLSLCAEFGFMDNKLYESRNCQVVKELNIIVGFTYCVA